MQGNVLIALFNCKSTIEAGPLMCAGITTYNALRNSGCFKKDAKCGTAVDNDGVLDKESTSYKRMMVVRF